MSRGPERKIEDDFVLAMDELGWLSRKGDIAAEQVAGELDRFFYGYGAQVVIIEFKREGAPKKRRGEKLQQHTRKQFSLRGFPTFVVIGRGDAAGVFNRITGEDFDEILKRARLVRSRPKRLRDGTGYPLPSPHPKRAR